MASGAEHPAIIDMIAAIKIVLDNVIIFRAIGRFDVDMTFFAVFAGAFPCSKFCGRAEFFPGHQSSPNRTRRIGGGS